MKTQISISRPLFVAVTAVCTAAAAVALTLSWKDSVTPLGKVFYLLVFAPCLVGAGCTVGFAVAALWAVVGAFMRSKSQHPTASPVLVHERVLVSLVLGTTVATTGVLLQQPHAQLVFSIVGGPVVAWFGLFVVGALVVYVISGLRLRTDRRRVPAAKGSPVSGFGQRFRSRHKHSAQTD